MTYVKEHICIAHVHRQSCGESKREGQWGHGRGEQGSGWGTSMIMLTIKVKYNFERISKPSITKNI